MKGVGIVYITKTNLLSYMIVIFPERCVDSLMVSYVWKFSLPIVWMERWNFGTHVLASLYVIWRRWLVRWLHSRSTVLRKLWQGKSWNNKYQCHYSNLSVSQSLYQYIIITETYLTVIRVGSSRRENICVVPNGLTLRLTQDTLRYMLFRAKSFLWKMRVFHKK